MRDPVWDVKRARKTSWRKCLAAEHWLEGSREVIWDSIETCASSRVKRVTSPAWEHETSARAWCTGKTQRDRVEREAGVGTGMGNTCKPMADSCQCMAKSTTIL